MQKTFTHRLPLALLVAALSTCPALGASAAAGQGPAAKAAKRSARHRARHSAPAGVVFGGVVSEVWPVLIQVSGDGREVVRASMDVPTQCQPGGGTVGLPSLYRNVPVDASGAFHDSLESPPVTQPDNTSMTLTSHLTGRFNRAMTAVTGTWSLRVVVHDATGLTTGTCDSGTVSFTAIQ